MEQKTKDQIQFRAGTEEMGTPKGDRSIIPEPLEVKEIVERARSYLAMNAAESGADVLIDELASLIESLSERVGELERGYAQIIEFSDSDMLDGDAARDVARALLSKQEERG